VAAVNRRVEDITGLTISTAEELQVVNYGIGGHYEPHFDFARVSIVLKIVVYNYIGPVMLDRYKYIQLSH
jgi:hypothetical protein